jgi:hypothetical protein
MTQKSTERTPRKSAPDVFQAVTCLDEQVFFYRLAVFLDERREAFDSPRASLPSFKP